MATNGFVSDLRRRFGQGDIVMRLLYINVAAFLVVSFCNILLVLFNASPLLWSRYLELPASVGQFVCQPWSLFTYMFMHAGLLHILFNMLWLYWFGRLFLLRFSSRHLRGVYVLGGVCGGLLYMLAYNVFPYFADRLSGAYLVGASASVLAIAVATAVRMPDYQIRLLFIGTIRLKYVAILVVVLDLLFMTSDNAGGHIAHIGGALAGWWFAAGLTRGYDITRWINVVFDFFGGKYFERKTPPKIKVHYSERQNDYDFNARKKAQSDEIDRKIGRAHV